MTYVDPAARLTYLREEMARQGLKRPRVDANGYPLPPEPEPSEVEAEPAPPARRAPAPNAAQGSSASGEPWTDPSSGESLPPPTEEGAARFGVRTELTNMRNLMRQDERRRENQRRTAEQQAISDQATRAHFQSRR